MADVRSETLYDLTVDDCWALLERSALGRLAVDVHGSVDIFPVNFVVHDRRLLFTTSEGTKLAALTVHAEVAFEVDGADEQTAWSVVLKGQAHTVDRADEHLTAERLPIVSWLPTTKTRIVVVEPDSVSGRGFVRGEEPDAEWY